MVNETSYGAQDNSLSQINLSCDKTVMQIYRPPPFNVIS